MRNLSYAIRVALLISAVFVSGCRSTSVLTNRKAAVNKIRYLGEYIISHNQQFKNTTIGGLSGIDYDKEKDLYYLVSDDWSQINPARFYTAKIFVTEKGIESV